MAFVGNNANLALEGEDPRVSVESRFFSKRRHLGGEKAPVSPGVVSVPKSQDFLQQVSFAAYDHWAKLTRADESLDKSEENGSSALRDIDTQQYDSAHALRTARWFNIFFLITTDILGPSNAPWAVSQLGYAPGVLLYFFMGLVAFYTGWQIWRMFLGLDSYRYPLRTYSQMAHRIYGSYAKTGVNALQSIQLLFNVSVLILGEGQALAQIAQFKVCFSVLMLVFMLAGMMLAQVRTFKNFGWFANVAVWFNLFIIFATMAIIGKSSPNYHAAQQQNGIFSQEPVYHAAFSGNPISKQIVAVMQMVYAYGGAMIFVEMLAEMRRPWDFWKGMASAQALIFSVYLLYGLFIYSRQGQYTINPANQGISQDEFGWQTALNILSLVGGLIAACLYGNVGVKVVYQTFVVEIGKGPTLDTRKGKLYWIPTVLCYWAIAFVLGSSIPQINGVSGVVAAACILQFTYTFPPILKVGYDVQRDALEDDGGFDAATGEKQPIDNWRDLSRWHRGFRKQWYIKLFNILIFLGGLATAALGLWASITSLIVGFQQRGAAVSFGCTAPV